MKLVILAMEKVQNQVHTLKHVVYVMEQAKLSKSKLQYLDKCKLQEHVQTAMEQVRLLQILVKHVKEKEQLENKYD